VGSQVMLLKNICQEKQLVNGSRGVVIGFINSTTVTTSADKIGEDFECRAWLRHHNYLPVVKFESQITPYAVTPEVFSVQIGDKLRAERCQLPLKLAWAITIHKCQGLTLDKVEMDLQKVFECGQGYVALSRARNLDGLRLLNFTSHSFRASEVVKQFSDQISKTKM